MTPEEIEEIFDLIIQNTSLCCGSGEYCINDDGYSSTYDSNSIHIDKLLEVKKELLNKLTD